MRGSREISLVPSASTDALIHGRQRLFLNFIFDSNVDILNL